MDGDSDEVRSGAGLEEAVGRNVDMGASGAVEELVEVVEGGSGESDADYGGFGGHFGSL